MEAVRGRTQCRLVSAWESWWRIAHRKRKSEMEGNRPLETQFAREGWRTASKGRTIKAQVTETGRNSCRRSPENWLPLESLGPSAPSARYISPGNPTAVSRARKVFKLRKRIRRATAASRAQCEAQSMSNDPPKAKLYTPKSFVSSVWIACEFSFYVSISLFILVDTRRYSS